MKERTNHDVLLNPNNVIDGIHLTYSLAIKNIFKNVLSSFINYYYYYSQQICLLFDVL